MQRGLFASVVFLGLAAACMTTSCGPSQIQPFSGGLPADAPCINYGDSITAGYYAQPQNGTGNIYSTNGYALLLDAAKLPTCKDAAISGTALMDTNIAQAILTTSIPQNEVSTIMIGTNDFHSTYCSGCSGGMSASTAQAQWKSGFAAELAWLGTPAGSNKVTAQSCPSSGTVTCTYRGSSWANSPAWGGTVAKVDENVGDTVTIEFSGTVFYFFYVEQLNNSSTFTLTLDGVNLPSPNGGFSNTGYIERTIVDATIQYSPALIRFSGLATGSHTLVMTNTFLGGTSPGTYFAGFAVPGGTIGQTGPFVFASNTPRAQPAGYATFGGSDPIVGQFDQMEQDTVNQLASDGLHIRLIDSASIMNPQDNALWWTDGFHPSTAGHAALAQAWEDATTAALAAWEKPRN